MVSLRLPGSYLPDPVRMSAMRPRLPLFLGALLCLFPALRSASSQPPPGGAPLAPDRSLPGIVFVGAPVFDKKTDGGAGVYQGSYHWRDGYVYPRSATFHRGERTLGPPRPGRNLYALVPARPDGRLTRLTHLTGGPV